MKPKEINDMLHWYVIPAVIVSMFILLLLCIESEPEPDPYQIDGVNRAEIVSRWEK